MERAPNKKEGGERIPDSIEKPFQESPGEELDKKLNALERRIQVKEERGEPVDISAETAKKTVSLAKRLKRIIGYASLGLATVTAVHETVSHTTSRYEISQIKGQEGELNYAHEDAETTRIMDFLTGKTGLAESDKVFFYRQAVLDAYRNLQIMNAAEYGAEEQNDFEATLPYDQTELHAKLTSILTEQGFLEKDADYSKKASEIFEEITQSPIAYDPKFETLLWEIQKNSGAPRIRWAATGSSKEASSHGSMAGHGRAWYDPWENTVYITPGELGATLIAENAHAYQFDKYPVASRAKGVLSMGRIALRSLVEWKSLRQSQYGEYELPGSLEYEAHKQIEPKILADAEKREQELRDNE